MSIICKPSATFPLAFRCIQTLSQSVDRLLHLLHHLPQLVPAATRLLPSSLVSLLRVSSPPPPSPLPPTTRPSRYASLSLFPRLSPQCLLVCSPLWNCPRGARSLHIFFLLSLPNAQDGLTPCLPSLPCCRSPAGPPFHSFGRVDGVLLYVRVVRRLLFLEPGPGHF